MEEKSKDRQVRFFVITVGIGILVYLFITLSFCFLLPRNAETELFILIGKEDFERWKILFCYSIPFLFIMSAMSFCAMKMWDMYLLSGILATGWLFEWMKRAAYFEPETHFLVFCGILLGLCLFLYPIIRWIGKKDSRFLHIHLTVTYLLVIAVNIAVFARIRPLFPYWKLWHLVLGLLIFVYILNP